MATVSDLHAILDEYNKDPESTGIELRLDLARIVIRQLDAKGWTERELAERVGFSESYVSQVCCSDANITFDSAGRLLHALGVKATLMAVRPG